MKFQAMIHRTLIPQCLKFHGHNLILNIKMRAKKTPILITKMSAKKVY